MKKLLFIIFLFVPAVLQARLQGQAQIDSLLNELPKAKEDTNKIKLLNVISYYMKDENAKEAIKYGVEGLQLGEKLRWNNGIGISCYYLSLSYKIISDHSKSIEYADKSLKIFKETGNKRNIAWCLLSMCNCYMEENNFPKAMECALGALKIAEELNDGRMVRSCSNNIGQIFLRMGDFAKARDYFFKGLKSNPTADKSDSAFEFANIGISYFDEGKFDLALEFSLRSLKIFEELHNNNEIKNATGNVANSYRGLGQYDKALDIEFRALKANEQDMDSLWEGNLLTNIGETYFYKVTDTEIRSGVKNSGGNNKVKGLENAILYIEKGNALSLQVGSLSGIPDAFQCLEEANRLLGNYKAALENYIKYIKFKDSVLSTDIKVKVANLSTQRETDLKEKQIEINKIQETKKRNELVLFSLGIGLLLIVIILILGNYRKQKLTNTKLESANKQLAAEKEKTEGLMHEQEDLLHQKEGLVAQLDMAARMKSKFLANISHELRTPVTLLTGMLELVKDNKGVRAGDQEKLLIAYQSSRKLQYMVNDILDLSKLDHTETKTNNEPKEIAPMLKRMVYAFETLMYKEQISLTYDDAGAQGLFVNVDEKKFEKIINNLVYNAIKFNRKGGWLAIHVHADVAAKEVVIEISDSAGGIKTEDLPHIFERYYQGGSQGVKAQGAGIGLSLVSEYTALMGGAVTVESREGDGTTFRLRFSIIENHSVIPRQELEPIELPVEAWTQFPELQTVLLVEDNAEMRYYVKEVLGGKVNIAETANGKEAMIWLESHVADLIISDIMMPEMDGMEFITRLKTSDAYKKIPVITLSALSALESQLGMLRMGVDDYMVKPFNADELRVRVYNLLHNRAERNAFSQLPAEPADIAETSKEADEFRTRITDFVLARIRNINISVFDLAFEFAMSERQLYRLAKSLTGCTPAQLIKEVRLQKAYELLVTGKMTKVEEVSKQVGFETAGYFSRQFAERFGRRPTEFL